MSTKQKTTLRLHMPQWQGGNLPNYHFGSQLLAWLAPPATGPVETVPVPAPTPGETLAVENGIVGRALLPPTATPTSLPPCLVLAMRRWSARLIHR